MFSFFQPKIPLISLFDNHTDIHNHILPGIDDGAPTTEDSIALLHALKECGITQFICTPHTITEVHPNTEKSITAAANELDKALQGQEYRPGIKTSSEYMLDEGFLELLKKEELLPLKDNYLLVEISYLQAPINLEMILFEITHAGYVPVLAHPERYNYFHNTYEYYAKLRKLGCELQLNALALSNYYGRQVALIARRLLMDDAYTYLGTDTHHLRHVDQLKSVQLNKKEVVVVKKLIDNTQRTFQF